MVVLSGSLFFLVPVPKVSAVTVEPSLGVYWDRSCSQPVSHVDWGRLSPGQVRDVVVYVRNEGNETFVLVLTPLNWSPENASQCLCLALNCEDRKIEVGQVADVILSLSVSPSIAGVYDFGFDMVLEGRDFFLGDLNRDGSVNIDDVAMVMIAMWTVPADSNWNPKADLDEDGVIDIGDLSLMCLEFGKSW